ncbi:C3a anaphylatoxin chemotactic receptor isoform X2 [Hyla sarda]|uniref:C3a anaphylatoxin chemotactic receptor isoform X2 n=1 Tax=Hyla sarda TaxID=327740 RepID=UPI0024C24E3A|nr:C3a anaphylatoxin chemotactic receptor isoform X2 [Hyla sarda]
MDFGTEYARFWVTRMFNGSDENPGFPHPHSQMTAFTTLAYTFTFLLGVPGNIMVLWVTGVKMKRTVNTIWFWNLAVADIMCCLSLPFSAIQLYYNEWLYGAALCKIIPAIVILNMFASIFTLVAISIDRCVQVVLPVWAQNHRSLRMAWFICLVIWILSFIMSMPAFLYRHLSTDHNITSCEHQFGGHDDAIYEDAVDSIDFVYNGFFSHNESDVSSTIGLELPDFGLHTHISNAEVTVTVSRMLFGFLFPLLIIAACYIRLALKVQNSRFLKVGRKTTKVVWCIILAFCFTWAPYHIIGMVLLYVQNPITKNLNDISVALAFCNSCINPVLYVFMGKDFKTKMKQSLRQLMESAFSEEVTKTTEHSRMRSSIQNSLDV